MPALPNVPNVIKAVTTITDSVSKHTAINRHFYQWSGTMDATDLGTVATAINGCYSHYLDSILATAWNVTSTTVTDLTSSSGLELTSTGSGGGGSDASPAPTAAAAVLINWKISRRYRGGKPKTFIGGIGGSSYSNESTVAGGTITTVTNFANALAFLGYTNSVPGTYGTLSITGLCNVSYYSGFTNYTKPSGREASRPTLRITPVVDTVQGLVVSAKIATQRRRLLAS